MVNSRVSVVPICFFFLWVFRICQCSFRENFECSLVWNSRKQTEYRFQNEQTKEELLVLLVTKVQEYGCEKNKNIYTVVNQSPTRTNGHMTWYEHIYLSPDDIVRLFLITLKNSLDSWEFYLFSAPNPSLIPPNPPTPMRALILALIASLLLTPSLSAATVSGEIRPKSTTTTSTSKTPTTKYYTWAKWGCYTLVKNTKTGKNIKRYVNKSFCKK